MGTTPTHSTRSTDRVALAIKIQIFGADIEGRSFTAEARTLEVSRNGALILVNRNLTPQEEIIIHSSLVQMSAPRL